MGIVRFCLPLLMLASLSACVTERITPSFPSQLGADGPPFLLFTPKVATTDTATKRPLVVVLHGCLQTADDMTKLSRMNEEAERAGFFVLYPQQARGRHPLNCWNWYDPKTRKPESEELARLTKMIDDVTKANPIDQARVYAVGLSSGGAEVSSLLACYPNRFAGAALISTPGYGIASNEQEAQLKMGAAPTRKNLNHEACAPSSYQGRLLIFAGSRDRTVQPQHSGLLAEQFTSPEERASKRMSTLPLVFAGDRPYRMVCFGANRVCRVEVSGLEHAWSGGQLYSFSDPSGPSAAEFIRRFVIEGETPKGLPSVKR